jgi:pyruvate kinase
VAAPDDAPSVRSTVTRAAIASIPHLGGALEVIFSDMQARRAAKAEQTMADILAITGEDELRARLGSVAEVEAVFVEGVQAALIRLRALRPH